MAENQIQVYNKVLNKSVHFILPLIGIRRFPTLLNCYLGDNANHPELNFRMIFVQSASIEDFLARNPYYYLSYTLEDKTYMFVYKIPLQFEKDYVLFTEGKYSKFSEVAKDKICSLQAVTPLMNSDVYQILYKTPKKRQSIEEKIGEKLRDEDEVCSIPDLDQEIYDTAKETTRAE